MISIRTDVAYNWMVRLTSRLSGFLKPFIVKSKKLDIKNLENQDLIAPLTGMDEMTDVTLVSGKVNVSLRMRLPM